MLRSGIILFSIVFALDHGTAVGQPGSSRPATPKAHSVLVAGVSSALVPGMGKLYLGYPYQAASAFIINTATASSAVELILTGADPAWQLASASVATIFYVGNIWGSAALALREKTELSRCPVFTKPVEDEHHKDDCLHSDSTGYDSSYLLAKCAFLESDYNRCYNLLLAIPETLRMADRKMLRLWLLSLTQTGNYERCRESLAAISDTSPAYKHEIEALPVSFAAKSPVKASGMSTILPGLGQCYAGYPLRGLVSFILNTGMAGAATYIYLSGLYITGTVYGLYPLLRLYLGGRELSWHLANRHNELQEEKLNKRYRELIFKILP